MFKLVRSVVFSSANHVERFTLFPNACYYVGMYRKGARIWVPHSTLVWEVAEVVCDYKNNELSIEFEDGRKSTLKVVSDDLLPPLRNPEILIGENDLTALSYLHEPAVLHNLKYRFCTLNTIYTYCGIVLVAINPYDELHIYDSDTIWTYRGKSQGDLEPHIFAVAEEAYAKLEREGRDQSIIVSGESGAGKTVSAKYAMRYFATVGGSSQETQVEKKVLSSSPIMEAIGNAKTTRNDNSSRFGKFIEIKFNKNYNIVGASMRTYLLEKSRVVFQAPDERNYHIFYQLCSARAKYPHLYLDHQDNFLYLNQGESPEIEGVEDSVTFEETLQALYTLGFSRTDQDNMFKILSGILHLGNVVIKKEDEGSHIKKSDKHLELFCKLLELDADDMRAWLCHRQIVSVKEVYNKPMSLQEAVSAKEALSKHMYAELFNWIVTIVNSALENTRERVEHRFIGVLDIYGFETFEINSFEQFCINYANEKLQQQFNQHVFKLEQEEYLKEKIEWKLIDFYDNQPCIDLIESKLGILDLLDEECRMPKGSDQTWAEKLYKTCSGKYKHFSKPRFGNSSFVIQHFADSVEYQVDGFLDKNRDSVIEEQINVLKKSQNDLVRKLFSEEKTRQLSIPQQSSRIKITPSAKTVPEKSKQHKKTVGSQFRDSLNLLMATLNATTPHYVRCIKPNDLKKAFEYNPQRAVQQLRACGVLETIRISAAGFPSRWLYHDFFNRYRVLCKFKDIDRSDMQSTCQKILANNIHEADKYQFGRTKIFFRAGQVAFLEKIRAEKLRAYCIVIQKQIRAFIQRKKFIRLKRCIFHIQRYCRGYLARQHAMFLRQTKAAIIIQRYVRGWVKRHQFVYLKTTMIGIQKYIRGYLARLRYQQLRYNHSAIIIQRRIRGFLARRRYQHELKKVIICQNVIRRFLARRLLRKLKKEARSVEHVKKLNKGLENKIISLQHKIGELMKGNSQIKTLEAEVQDLRAKTEVVKSLEAELKKSIVQLLERDKEIKILSEKIIKEQSEKMDILHEKTKVGEKLKEVENDNKNLKKELDLTNEKIKKNQFGAEENLKARIQQEKTILIHEHEQDLENYQKLLKEYGQLEQRNENLEKLVEKLSARHSRTPSDLSSLPSSHTSTEFENDDNGYSSNKSTLGRDETEDIEDKDRSLSEISSEKLRKFKDFPDIDVGLLLKLQQKLKEVEKERDKLFLRVESLEKEESPSEERQRTFDSLRLEELEIENEKLKTDLSVLRDSLAMGDPGTKELLNQFRSSERELDRRRDEIVQLRAVLATQTKGLKNIAKINYGSTNDVNLEVINEDGELVVAFEAQKRINQQLEEELQQEKERRKVEKEEYKTEIVKLKEDNDRQQKLLSVNLNKTPQSQTEAYMQHEISRLTTENLDLQEKYDAAQETTRKLKKQNKLLLKKLKEFGVGLEQAEMTSATTTTVAKQTKKSDMVPVMMKKERNYQGMFEYRIEDEQLIIRHLIYDLKPRVAMHLLPGLPAYISFMCIRHTDFVNDDDKVRSFLTAFINAVRKVIRKKHDDFETTVLWLSNTLRLLHNLKQYSGDRMFQSSNTPKQNEQCLRNFDLSQYRQVLSDLAIWVYQAAIRDLQEKITHLIVPAILEHEAIAGLPHGLSGRHRASSVSSVTNNTSNPQKKLDVLLVELSGFHRILAIFGVDPEVISQVFKQTFYFICASSLNNLLLRKDLCHWTKGMQIRYNLSHLEQWTRDQKLNDPAIVETLQPIVQASHLLQARKTEEDVKSLCDMCDKLTVQRIIKLLHLYTPADEYEERVPVSFLRKIQAELQSRMNAGQIPDAPLLMDTKQVFPVRFPFNPSKIRLEDIEIPENLDLPMLKKV